MKYKNRYIFKKKKLPVVAYNNSFFSMNDCFLRLWIKTPRLNWEIHMGWEHDVWRPKIRPG